MKRLIVSCAWIALLYAAILSAAEACSSGNSDNSSSSKTCCSIPMDDSGIGLCECQPVGTVSVGNYSSTLSVSGSTCTVTSGGMSSVGMVVSSCADF